MKIFKDTWLDGLSVSVTMITACIPFFIAFGASYWLALAFVVLANLHLNGPMHYHIHRPMFESDVLNRAYELLCTSVALVGFQEYKFIHIEHHKYTNDAQVNGAVNDPVSTYRWGNGEEESFLSYVFKGSFRNVMQGYNLALKIINIDSKKYNQEAAVKLFVVLALAVINVWFIPLYTLMLYVAWTVNWALSYCEHYAVTNRDDHRRDSASCYNRIYNLLLFNTGHHQEHHYRPGVHWTKLPEIRKQLPVDRLIVSYTLFNNNPFSRGGNNETA
jgi:fatty acid desaturase